MAQEGKGHGHGHHEEAPAAPPLTSEGTSDIAVTINAEGTQVNGLVFRKPVAGESFAYGDLWVFNPKSGAVEGIQNDEGVIPYRERTSDDEDLGLTWQFKK